WLLYREVRWLLASEDAIRIACGPAALINAVWSIADQTAVGDKQPVAVHCRQTEFSRQRDDQLAMNNCSRIRYHYQATIRGAREVGNGSLDFVGGLRAGWARIYSE